MRIGLLLVTAGMMLNLTFAGTVVPLLTAPMSLLGGWLVGQNWP